MQLCGRAWLWSVNLKNETSIHLPSGMASHPSLHESGMRCNKFDTVFLFTAFLEKLELIWNFLPFSSLSLEKHWPGAKKKNYEKLWTRHWAWALKIARMAFARLLNFTIMRMASWSERHDRQEKCMVDEVATRRQKETRLNSTESRNSRNNRSWHWRAIAFYENDTIRSEFPASPQCSERMINGEHDQALCLSPTAQHADQRLFNLEKTAKGEQHRAIWEGDFDFNYET